MSLLVRLSLYFSAFLAHCFLPETLSNVLLIPLIKNKLKDSSRSDNYRPIAIATAASKVFERALLNRLAPFLNSSDNQFGFKQQHSTELCIMALKEVVRYYFNLNTPVFICFLDIKSAFDRISYWLLLCKLHERGVPVYLLLLLKFWFSSQQLYVRWGRAMSNGFTMSNGVRQGSVLSPLFFNVYVDEFSHALNASNIGCHVANKPLNNFSYADDMALVCPSACALNRMLRLCEKLAVRHYITYSVTKSECMVVSPRSLCLTSPPSIYLNGSQLKYVNSFTYLGHIIVNEFYDDEDIRKEMRNLCARGNAIIRKFSFCNMDVKCSLYKTYCYPFYCGSLWTRFRVATMDKLKVMYNMVMRRLAGVPPWHSARQMFVSLGVQSFSERLRGLCHGARERARGSGNTMVQALVQSDATAQSDLWHRWSLLLDLDR